LRKGGDKMAEETPSAENTMKYFQKMYKGEELPPFTIFHGLSTKCTTECGWKD